MPEIGSPGLTSWSPQLVVRRTTSDRPTTARGWQLKRRDPAVDLGFRVAEGRPRKTQPRFEVAQRWVGKDVAPDSRLRVGQVAQGNELPVRLRRDGRHLVTQTKIQSQILSYFPSILHVSAEDGLASIAR